MNLEVLNKEGKTAGRAIELPDEIFAAEPNSHVIWLAVKQYLAAQRQGTHKVKTRAEVKGSSRKLHKQKGTGGSRKGNIRNPLYKGGGTVFGPKPHKYELKLNRKVKDLARIGALSSKAKDNKIAIVEDFSFDTPSTKDFLKIMDALQKDSRKTLFVMPEHNETVYKSFRNVANVCGTLLSDIHTYDILNADNIVFTENAAKIFVDDIEADVKETADEKVKETQTEKKEKTSKKDIEEPKAEPTAKSTETKDVAISEEKAVKAEDKTTATTTEDAAEPAPKETKEKAAETKAEATEKTTKDKKEQDPKS
ncbi:hypothetical protein BH20BAC1_BH20BAC1_06390 [soil metagenome]